MELISDRTACVDFSWWHRSSSVCRWTLRSICSIQRLSTMSHCDRRRRLSSSAWPVRNTLAFFSWTISNWSRRRAHWYLLCRRYWLSLYCRDSVCRWTLFQSFRWYRPMDSTTSVYAECQSNRWHRSNVLNSMIYEHRLSIAFFSKLANSNDKYVLACHSIWSPSMRPTRTHCRWSEKNAFRLKCSIWKGTNPATMQVAAALKNNVDRLLTICDVIWSTHQHRSGAKNVTCAKREGKKKTLFVFVILSKLSKLFANRLHLLKTT